MFKALLREFRDFINRGNVIDLAVAVVIGAAFGAVVNSFVNDILNGFLGAIGGKPSLGDLSVTLGQGEIRYGAFLDSVLTFLIVAAAIFAVIKAVNSLQRGLHRAGLIPVDEGDTPETGHDGPEVELLRQILAELRRQP